MKELIASKKESIAALVEKYLPKDSSSKEAFVDELFFILLGSLDSNGKTKKQNEELERNVQERTAQLRQSLKKLKESEERFQKAFQASAAGIAITNVSTSRYFEVNQAFINITGFSREEIIGRTSLELGIIVNVPKREEILKQIREKGRSQHFQNTIKTKTGEFKEVLSSAETILIDGELFAISVIFDITDRKRAEDELKKSDALFTSLFEENPAALAISRLKDKIIISINEAFLKLFGYESKSEVIGKTSLELGFLNEPGQVEEILRQLSEKNKIATLEGAIRTKKGSLKWTSVSIIKIEIDGESCLLAVILDLTDRKNTEEQLVNVNKELEAFSYSVSHDLRAPLRAINGYSQMLLEDYALGLDEEGKRIVQVISTNAVKMGVLIDELLAFSRLGRKDLSKSQVDMNSLVLSALDDLKRSIPHVATLHVGTLLNVEGDYGLLYQVMFNLISNAIKYSSKCEQPEIEIISLEKENEVVFSVSDNGVGFDMAYAEKLFEVFQRLHSHEEFEGVGVGLAIVRRIVSKHGGRVWAYGEVDNGATFYFSLPKVHGVL